MTDKLTKPGVTLATLQDMKRQGEKIASLTCYDSSFTQLLEAAGIDVFIIGDSLGMVLKGFESTVPVGSAMAATVTEIVSHDIPVCGHIGLLPQSIEQLGGYKVQGRDAAAAAVLQEDARVLQEAGAGMLVMECIPADLAAEITASVSIPTIGIGAGPGCDGQVLVLYDMLGITPGKPRKFVRDFLAGTGSIRAAVEAYIRAVKDGSYPAPEHSF
jgi:3-methyl-2-oxobutanoate hydroxymethyltransferase